MRSVLVALGLSFVGCSATPPECAAISQRCSAAVMSGSASRAEMDCYDNARTVWTASQCVDNLAVCQAACLPASGDGGH